MSTLSLVAEWIVPLAASCGLLLVAGRGVRRMPDRLLEADVAWAGWLLTRVAYLLLLAVWIGTDLGSDMWAWRDNTGAMARGAVPGRDFFNLYGPLYPYLQYVGRSLTPGFHEVGTLWPFVAGDFLVVWAGGRIATDLLGSREGRWVRLWLVLDPLLWHQLVVRSQDEALFAGTLLASVLLLHRERVLASVAVLAVGLCSTKITYAPYALGVLLAVPGGGRQWLRAWSLWIALVATGYGLYAATGAHWMSGDNYATHSVKWGAGLSVPDTVRRFLPAFPLEAGLALYAFSCALAIPWFCRLVAGRSVLERAVLGVAMAHAVSLLTMPCSVSPYLAQGSAFLLLAILGTEVPSSLRSALLVLLAATSGLAVMAWTKSRVFSISLRPAVLLLLAWLGILLWRSVAARGVARAPSPEGAA